MKTGIKRHKALREHRFGDFCKDVHADGTTKTVILKSGRKNGSLSGTTTRSQERSSRSIFLRKLLAHSSACVRVLLASLKLLYAEPEFASSPARALLTESTTKLVLQHQNEGLSICCIHNIISANRQLRFRYMRT